MPYHPTKEDIAFAQALFREAANKAESIAIISDMLCVPAEQAKQILALTPAEIKSIENSPKAGMYIARKGFEMEKRKKPTPAECRAAAKEALRLGLNGKQGAEKFGISQKTMCMYLKQLKTESAAADAEDKPTPENTAEETDAEVYKELEAVKLKLTRALSRNKKLEAELAETKNELNKARRYENDAARNAVKQFESEQIKLTEAQNELNKARETSKALNAKLGERTEDYNIAMGKLSSAENRFESMQFKCAEVQRELKKERERAENLARMVEERGAHVIALNHAAVNIKRLYAETQKAEKLFDGAIDIFTRIGIANDEHGAPQSIPARERLKWFANGICRAVDMLNGKYNDEEADA